MFSDHIELGLKLSGGKVHKITNIWKPNNKLSKEKLKKIRIFERKVNKEKQYVLQEERHEQ